MRRTVGPLAGIGLSFALAGSALAAQPNNQACLGHDVSGYAADGSDFGRFVANVVATDRGAGGEVQLHLAGQVPDEAIPNTCND